MLTGAIDSNSSFQKMYMTCLQKLLKESEAFARRILPIRYGVLVLAITSVGNEITEFDTVPANHPIVPLIGLLKSHGKLVMVGALEKSLELPVFPLLQGRKLVAGSMIGGLKETQEMIDFYAKHDIKPEVGVIHVEYVNIAMERLLKADVKYRFVIDIGNTLNASS
ncbi:hypothetical protein RYX36_004774 [Vicia faba]